jgi:hypothetical protein
MRRLAVVLGYVLILVGGAWALQGSGLVKGSFMTGERTWFWIGIACVAVGLVTVISILGRRRPR